MKLYNKKSVDIAEEGCKLMYRYEFFCWFELQKTLLLLTRYFNDPNVADFVELKDCTRDVTTHWKSYNILTDVKSVNNEMKLLLTRAG